MTFMPYYGDAWPTLSPDGKSIAVFLGEEGRYGDYWVMLRRAARLAGSRQTSRRAALRRGLRTDISWCFRPPARAV
jgi:hypothetical protein